MKVKSEQAFDLILLYRESVKSSQINMYFSLVNEFSLYLCFAYPYPVITNYWKGYEKVMAPRFETDVAVIFLSLYSKSGLGCKKF